MTRELANQREQLNHYAENLEGMVAEKISEKLKLEQQLFQIQKMEAIGTLAGGIAHDFNNLLWGVMGYASYIRTIRPHDQELNKYVEIIEKSAKKASGLTHKLLTLSRQEYYEFLPIKLEAVSREACYLLEKSVKSSVKIDCKSYDTIHAIDADANQLEQAVINMGINADHAMPNGGILTVGTEDVILESPIEDIPAGTYVVLKIQDTGTGIPEAIRLKIFDPFFTTKPKGKGTGFGLAMVYSMVKNHHGYIHVQSEEGKGTTFSLYFPASHKKAITIKEMDSPMEFKGEGTILVVDNEEVLRQMLARMLTTLGYKVLEAENGADAIKTHKKHASEIKLVVLDMHMPGMDGRETFHKLREANPELKVLISSGFMEGEDIQEVLAAGAAGLLGKPYGIKDISKKIHQVLAV